MNSEERQEYKRNYWFFFAGAAFGIFVGLLLLLLKVDVKDIGVENTNVGLSTINSFFKEYFPYRKVFEVLSNVIGYLDFIVCLIFGIMGIIQLFKRKSLFKVDKDIICLGSLYVITLIIYFVFSKIAINYRPYDLGDGLEASFPSSHTLMAIVIMGSLIFEANLRLKENKYNILVKLVAVFYMIIVISFRVLSGIHWFTDIIGSILLGICLVLLFCGISMELLKKESN